MWMPTVCWVCCSCMVSPAGNANSCCRPAVLQETFLTFSLSFPAQMMPAQERTARCLKAPMENMKIILGSSGVRSSVCFVVFLGPWFSAVPVSQLLKERKGRATGVSSPYIWSNNKQSVSWMCWCEWIPSKGPAKCSLWLALGSPAIYPSMVLPCICFSGQWLLFCMCSSYSFHRLPIKSILTFTAIFPKVFSANITLLPLRANGRSDFTSGELALSQDEYFLRSPSLSDTCLSFSKPWTVQDMIL